MLDRKEDPQIEELFQLPFGKRPAEELFDLRKDPGQLVNVADRDAYADHKRELAAILMKN